MQTFEPFYIFRREVFVNKKKLKSRVVKAPFGRGGCRFRDGASRTDLNLNVLLGADWKLQEK